MPKSGVVGLDGLVGGFEVEGGYGDDLGWIGGHGASSRLVL